MAATSPAPQLTRDDLIQLKPSPQARLDHRRHLRRGSAVQGAKTFARIVLCQLEGDMN